MSFRAGFSHRVYDRLMEMKREADARQASQCRDLIVLKDQLVTEEFRKNVGVKLVKRREGRNMAADQNAYRQGMARGGQVNLRNPLGDPAGSGARLR
jgi:hypothetical protein